MLLLFALHSTVREGAHTSQPLPPPVLGQCGNKSTLVTLLTQSTTVRRLDAFRYNLGRSGCCG
jgi:hypothetical protein